jgi:hypothetical protein
MTSIRGQDNRVEMMLPGGQLTALVFYLTKKVDKAEELSREY